MLLTNLAIKRLQNFPPHLTGVNALPWETINFRKPQIFHDFINLLLIKNYYKVFKQHC